MNWNDIPEAPSPHRALARIRLSPEVWSAIRERYLKGESAEALTELFGISLSAFRTRAREEGWRRIDAPDPAVASPPTCDELARDGRPNFRIMADTAMRRAAHAVREGQLTEALGWTRVGRSLTAAARREHRGNESS